MRSAIVVHESFDAVWPLAADYWRQQWESEGPTRFVRDEEPEPQLLSLLPEPALVTRLAALLELDNPLLGRANVVHTPHIAGRTREANLAWVDDLLSRFKPTGKREAR